MKAIDRHLADHDGVITAQQAYAFGLTDRQVRHRAATGQWQRLSRGVYLSEQHHLTDAARLRVAVAIHRAVADRTAAAYWHGLLDDLPPVVTLSAPRSTRGTARSPVATQVKRRTFPAEDVEELRGILVTRRPLTVLAAAGELDDGVALVDRCLQTGEVTVGALCSALDRNTGLHGLQVGRELVGVLEAGSESVAERLFVKLLRLHGITGWVQQLPFGGGFLDFAWPEQRVAVEINGWAYHRSSDRFEADGEKASRLAAAGWLDLPLTWNAIRYRPEECIARLVAALNSHTSA